MSSAELKWVVGPAAPTTPPSSVLGSLSGRQRKARGRRRGLSGSPCRVSPKHRGEPFPFGVRPAGGESEEGFTRCGSSTGHGPDEAPYWLRLWTLKEGV